MAWTTPKTWTAGEVMTAANMNLYLRDNTELMGASRPMARVYASTAQTLTTATQTNVLFDTETFDVGNMHSTTVNSERLTITTPGLYLFQASVSFAANATGYRRITLTNQGGGAIASEARVAFGTFNSEMTIVGVDRMAAGNYAYPQVAQTSGGNLATVAGGYTAFSAFWIGPY